MTPRWAALVLIFAGSAATFAGPKLPPTSRIERTPEFVNRVNEAIARGVEWLKSEQAADGSFLEYGGFPGATTAMAYHTMRACGVAKDDPSAKSAWDALRRGYRKDDLRTYSAALYLMAIASHGDPIPKAADDRDVRLAPEVKRWAEEIARVLAGGQNSGGGWSYRGLDVRPSGSGLAGGRADGNYDHSNTQYALLGLKCAARCGIAVDASVWKNSLVHFLETQETSGPGVPRKTGGAVKGAGEKGRTSGSIDDHARGWAYTTAGRRQSPGAYTSMTAAGVSSVVICRSELLGTHGMSTRLDAESERSVWDGLAWIGTNWGNWPVAALRAGAAAKRAIPTRAYVNFYEFYGVERAGVLAGVDWMADLDWYSAGAEPLLDTQGKDGSWGAGSDEAAPAGRIVRGRRIPSVRYPIDTCFALLFLKKGTTPVRRGAVTQALDDTDINFAEAAKLNQTDFEDFIDLVASRWRRASDEGVKTRLFDGATSVGPRIVEPLFVRMDSRDVEKRASAHALLRHATGLDFGYVADASPEARDAAVEKWLAWWIGAKERALYDPTTKRLVVR